MLALKFKYENQTNQKCKKSNKKMHFVFKSNLVTAMQRVKIERKTILWNIRMDISKRIRGQSKYIFKI